MNENTDVTVLTDEEEQKQLAEIEQQIYKCTLSYLEIGRWLSIIQNNKLYRSLFPTFERYLKDRAGILPARAYRLISSWRCYDHLQGHSNILPDSEWQIRPLTTLDKEQWLPAWERALEKSPGPRPRGVDVGKAAKEFLDDEGTDADTDADTDTPTPQSEQAVVTDELDNALSGRPSVAFNKLDQFKQFNRIMNDARRALVALATDDEIGAHIDGNSLNTQLRNVQIAIRWGKPYALCPFCKNLTGDGCRTCKKRGWVTKAIYDKAPESIKQDELSTISTRSDSGDPEGTDDGNEHDPGPADRDR